MQEELKTGIFVLGCARTALDMVVAAGQSADVVKRWEHIMDSNSLEDTVPVPVAVVFKHRSALQV